MAHVEFHGGPAAGVVKHFDRHPVWLRVVRDQQGEFDVLDQLDDEPKPDESIFVYHRTQVGFACSQVDSVGNGQPDGRYATYEYVEDVDGEEVRATAAWRRRVDKLARKAA